MQIYKTILAPKAPWPYGEGAEAPVTSRISFRPHLHSVVECKIFNFLKDNPFSSAELLCVKLSGHRRALIRAGLASLVSDGFVAHGIPPNEQVETIRRYKLVDL